mmetsp:Transcript_17096/g.49079  ORF Transcript_17096/g.49079 Transcript_17096/m.49079 type:complete len:628 (-) Transcript_17096:55-1938(-)
MISRCGLSALRISHLSATSLRSAVAHGDSFRPARSSLLLRPRSVWSSAGASPRDLADLEDKVLGALKANAIDPVLNKDVVSLGWVRGVVFPHSTEQEQPVRVSVRLPTMLHPSIGDVQDQIQGIVQQEIHSFAKEKGWEVGANSDSIGVDVSAVPSKPVPLAQTAAEHAEIIKKLGPGLANVGQFLAVYSCKGGVGKSTVATNLAYELSRLGARVGLLDVDIYGPSLPVLVKPDDPAVRRSAKGSGMVHPIDHRGVKLMSLGYVSPNSGVPGSGPAGGPAVMRGPMAGRVVAQLLKGTDWGELDVLVLDLPPGTGDVQLEVCQSLQLSGAVCVTTPSKLAVADAVKGVEMFAALGVPTLATVQNMSFFDCEGGSRHYPFGKGIIVNEGGTDNSNASALEAVGIDVSSIVQLPISPLTNGANDSGEPLCLERPGDGAAELQAFEGLAKVVSQEMLLVQHGVSRRRSPENGANCGSSDAVVTFDSGAGQKFDVASLHMSVDSSDGESFAVRLFSDAGAWQGKVGGMILRSVDPKTGERMADADAVDEGPKPKAGCGSSSAKGGINSVVIHRHKSDEKKPRLFPAKVEKKGIYGYSVEWADGATIIYSMLSIAKAAGGHVNEDKWSVDEK